MNEQYKLSRQLLIIVIVVFIVITVFLGIVLPQSFRPIYEQNLYNYLKSPLNTLVEEDLRNNSYTGISYVYIYKNQYITSNNYDDLINVPVPNLRNQLKQEYGNFKYGTEIYYYYQEQSNDILKVAITNDDYIEYNQQLVFYQVFPIIIITLLIVALLLIIWSSLIVRKVEKLKEKIDNFDNDQYDHDETKIKIDDEIKSLALAIEDMRISLKTQKEIRNQMYQNISHDFKTPLTVIKSYVEAVKDGIEQPKQALITIEDQTKKLNQKVDSLLHLNKLEYLKDLQEIELKEVDLNKIINDAVKKFKFARDDIDFIVKFNPKVKYYGTDDLWESIVDNIFSNFIRYADKTIRVTAVRGKLIFYNDGENIAPDLLEVIFMPFRKGIKGQYGLGMSIIKSTLNLMNYDIIIKNERKGVSFIIKQGVK